MLIKPLLVYLQAADYPQVLKPLKEIPCDKLILKYYPYPHPHNIAREYFLNHPEYTHMIVLPQDLIATKENYLAMVKTLQQNDYPVLSAACNVGKNGPLKYCYAACMVLPSYKKAFRHYNWIPFGLKGIIQVKFQGHVFDFIRRDVIERRTIDGNYIFRGAIHTDGGPAPDLTFAHGCNALNIPIHVNFDVNCIHLATHEKILVHKKNVETVFEPYRPTNVK